MTSWNIEFSSSFCRWNNNVRAFLDVRNQKPPLNFSTNQEWRRGKTRNNLGHPCAWWTLLWGSEGMEEHGRMSLFQQVLHGLLSLDSHPTFQRPTPTVEFVKVPQLLKHQCLSIYLWLSLTLKKSFELWQKKAKLVVLLGSWCLEQYVSRVRRWIRWKPFLFWRKGIHKNGVNQMRVLRWMVYSQLKYQACCHQVAEANLANL